MAIESAYADRRHGPTLLAMLQARRGILRHRLAKHGRNIIISHGDEIGVDETVVVIDRASRSRWRPE
jgi:hypothetical protein